MKILNFGSLNIDETFAVPHFVGAGETLSSTGVVRNTGGKGLNQSVALARAGASVYHAGCIGEDGQFLLDFLQNAGVDCRYVQTVDTPTGRAIIQVTPEGQNSILLFGGANQAISRDRVDTVLSAFTAGDILLLQNEINNLPYIVEKAAALGLLVALNPSPFTAGLLELPKSALSYLLLNEVEAAQMCGETDGDKQIAALRAAYPHAGILLTLGSRGSMYAGAGGVYRQPAYRVKAVDTTGAGDTFTGYFLASLSGGVPVEKALDTAARAAAIAVSRPGAAAAIPTPDEVATYTF